MRGVTVSAPSPRATAWIRPDLELAQERRALLLRLELRIRRREETEGIREEPEAAVAREAAVELLEEGER